MTMAAFFTQAAGVDTIFGAFLVGLIVPHDRGFAISMTEKIEDLISIMFLPLYFAYSGLGVNLGTLNTPQAFGFVVLVIIVACAGTL
jgi:Kef-type K+ transport system membrane component KefB